MSHGSDMSKPGSGRPFKINVEPVSGSLKDQEGYRIEAGGWVTDGTP